MNVYLKKTKYEFLKMLRSPRFALMTLSMPLLFYILYAVVIYKSQRLGGTAVPNYMLATFGAFGVLGVCLFGIGINLANERGLGWLEVKRASPLPPLSREADHRFVILRGRSGRAFRARLYIGARTSRSFR
jgi:ABC-2 type transport system permease protein